MQVARLEVTGMHCSSCSTAVERALNATEGVKEAAVSLSLNMAEVTYDPSLATEVPPQRPHFDGHLIFQRRPDLDASPAWDLP